jgi:hypothetical protein
MRRLTPGTLEVSPALFNRVKVWTVRRQEH